MDKGGNSDHVELRGFRESSTEWDLHLIIKNNPNIWNISLFTFKLMKMEGLHKKKAANPQF